MSEPNDRLIFYQLSNEGNHQDPSRAHAVSMVASRYGDGQHSNFGIFILAHSVGGDQARGAKVATGVARGVATEIMRNFYHPALLDTTPPPLNEIISEAIVTIDGYLRTEMSDVASALTVAIVLNDRLHLAHVGNNRFYLIKSGEIKQLTTDYGLPEEGNGTGHIVRALGYGEQAPEIEILTEQLPHNAQMLLCNKQVWAMIGADEINDIVSRYGGPQGACNAIVDRVKERDGNDIAAILMRMPAI